MEWKEELTPKAMKLTQLELGLKLIATIDHRGWPHITLISFNKAKNPHEIVWGQFVEGSSKKNVLRNSKQAAFYMNAKMPFKFVQVKMDLERTQKGGEDCEEFSRSQMLRYMTYTNVHTAYYNQVVAATNIRPLGLFGILKGALVNFFAKSALKLKNVEEKLPEFGYKIINQVANAKVLAFIDTDGYPIIIPVFGLAAPDKHRLVFPLTQFKDELTSVIPNSKVATYVIVSAGMELTSIHVNGTLKGFKKARGVTYGIIDIDEVYNSMPPLHGVIYPKRQIRPKVTDFPTEIKS
ncbi:MAG: hypothetical protein ACTSW1_05740 [Candidatus Hodarchaeales archaeon]